MPELNNSQRRLYKATYAPTRPDVAQREGLRLQPLQRAVEKSRFVDSLAVHPSELAKVRTLAQDRSMDDDDREKLHQAIEAVDQTLRNPAPDSVVQTAAVFRGVPAGTLVEFGRLLEDTRKAAVQEIETRLSALREDYESAVRSQPASEAPVEMPPQVDGEKPSLDVRSATPSGMRVRLRRFEREPHGSPRNIGVLPQVEGYQEPEQPGTVAEPVQTRAPHRVLLQLQRLSEESEAQPAAVVPPAASPLQAALRWAAVNQPQSLEPLRSLSQQLSPVPLVYNTLSMKDQAVSLVEKLQKWGDYTHWLVESFQDRMKIEPIGRLHLERLEMTPVGIERGELVYSVPLAPKEMVNLTHKEWATTSEEFEKIVQDSFEGYSEQGVTEKNELTQATESQSKHNTALDLGATVTGSYGTVTVSASAGYHTASDDLQSQKDSRNHSITLTRKASSRAKKDHKVTFKVASASGTEDQAVRVITNPSDTDAMRVDYYQLIRKWRVDLQRYGLRMTYDIVIPNPGGDLRRKLDEVRMLDAQISQPFYFPVALTDIQRDTWYNIATMYDGQVEPPKEQWNWIVVHKEFKPIDQKKLNFDALEFEVPEDYTVEEATLVADLAPGDDPMWPYPFFNLVYEPDDPDANRPYISSMDNLLGKSGKLSIIFSYTDAAGGSVQAWVKIKMKDNAFLAWQYKAWSAIRTAAEEAYYQQRTSLREHRAELLEEIGGYDALTLRRMEREEIMKGVLRWLFGPSFDLVPFNIQTLFEPVWDNPMAYDVKDMSQLSQQEWMRMMKFGEFIKFIHQAVEWENVLSFTYPYFWNSPENWNALRFLDHPDPMHRVFLRAGAARVVLTIRPGFEDSFSRFVETGAFDALPSNHPYVTIAQEIQNFANTNYPGIPPANKEAHARPLLYPEQRKAWDDMQKVMQLLEAYRAANDDYPTPAQGLAALAPFTNTEIPDVPQKDPWGNDFVYTSPALVGPYELLSMGHDGVPGGEDLDADLSSASEASLIASWFEYTPTSALDISLNTILANIPG